MIKVTKRHVVKLLLPQTAYAIIVCCSLFIPVMNAQDVLDNQEMQLPREQQESLETVEFPEDTHYYRDDAENEEMAFVPEDEFTQQEEHFLEQHESPTTNYMRSATQHVGPRVINDIIVSGNELISEQAILNYVPYRKGDVFDATKTGKLIHTLYASLKRFKNIQIMGELTDDGMVNVHIVVEEKPVIKEIIFKGNNKLAEKDIRKKIDFDMPALDEAELKLYVLKLQKLYREKNYHRAQIDATMELDEQGKSTITFTIDEGKKTLVNRIVFAGNKNVSGKELRKILYTREDWILSFLDNAGSFQTERLEADKHMIEQYYQNKGYLKAKVLDAEIIKNEGCDAVTIVFHVEEGNVFTVSEVCIDGQGVLNEEFLLTRLPVQAGDLYSREKIADSIKILEMLWGDMGYIYAHINPVIVPDEDNCTVKVSFETDAGNKVILNKITILGNKKTRDRIVRRRLLLEEGSLLTHFGMEESKNRIESLGYFDVRDGVNWKIRRIDNEHADLDLILKEVKTGHANFKLGFGGSPTSLQVPGTSASIGVEISDSNLFGSGLQFNFQGNMSKDEQNIFFNITEPWLFDKPILAAFDLYHRRPSYDEFKNTEPVNEILTGGALTVGFVTALISEVQVISKLGIDSLMYEKRPIARIIAPNQPGINLEYQHILDKEFEPVDFVWLSCMLSQDRRNNPMHTSKGIRWNLGLRAGLPSLDSNVGFGKFDFDFHWFTPLIGDTDLIFHLHTYLGIVAQFSRNKIIPYRELFHIGGPASVRGFLFGQLSPLFRTDSIGGKRAFFTNIELIFPITADFGTKALVFYDGGCGWDNPYAREISAGNLFNNNFNYRHAVGFGIRMLNPAPIRIDWGFKLDRRKKLRETPSEVHFGMTYDW